MKTRDMTANDLRTLPEGSIVRHRLSGNAYVVIQKHQDSMTAVRSVEVSSAHEWLVIVDKDDAAHPAPTPILLVWKAGGVPQRSVAEADGRLMYEVGFYQDKWYWLYNWRGIHKIWTTSEDAAKAAAQKDFVSRQPPQPYVRVTDEKVEAAAKAIYEHKPYLNYSGTSHMAWSVYKRELADEYDRLKIAVRIGLEAASTPTPNVEGDDR